jgi:2-amino-4-hydroxy-6-hydroxymethyldihydropteridine diphosphokinase
LDIDLLTYGDRVGTLDGRELPRHEIFRYAFVLGPLAEVAPDEICPGTILTYRDLWAGSAARGQPLVAVTMWPAVPTETTCRS